MTGPTIAAGEVQFAQAKPVPLPAGTTYNLNVSQSVTVDGKSVSGTGEGPYSQPFTLTPQAPRFSLDASEIYSMYPPGNAKGLFRNALPQVVFTSPSLPWERSIDGSVTPRGNVPTPWLAVLLLQDTPGAPLNKGAPALENKTVADVLSTGSDAIQGPVGLVLEEGQSNDDPVMTVDIPVEQFSVCAPQELDLPYLAHCRQVGQSTKVTPVASATGWFSVVAGNRLPAEGAKATAYLVSMEGFQTLLPPATMPAAVTTVRMVAFASWSFTDTAELDFVEMMKLVKPGIFCLPPPDEAGDTTKTALACGYTAHNTTTRQGDPTVSWYRGPFVPYTLTAETVTPEWCSDALMRFDPDLAMFDLSYAAAWETGRLVALSDEQFAEALFQWRRQNQNTAAKLMTRLRLAQANPKTLAVKPQVDQVLHSHLVRLQMADVWQRVGNTLCGQNKQPGAFGPVADPSGLRRSVGSMPGLLKPEDLTDLASSPDPVTGVFERLLGTDGGKS